MNMEFTEKASNLATTSRRRMMRGAAQAMTAGVAALGTNGVVAATTECTAPARHNKAPQASLTTVATFPPGYFLENLAVREDNSVLVTVLNKKELWYVPQPKTDQLVTPLRLHTFEQLALGIAEVERDVFYIVTANIYANPSAPKLHRLDLRGWVPGRPVAPTPAFEFPTRARATNGMCLVAPGVLLVADSFAGLIWRINLGSSADKIEAKVWLEHSSMSHFPGKMKPEQPGVNGVRFAAKTHHVYYTATAKKLLMRVAVDPSTLDPVGEPEIVVAGRMGDDLCLDEEAGVIYLTTHRQNTIDLVSMDPGENSGFTQIVAGDPFTKELVGPSSGAWGRAPGDPGRVAYFTTDGGTASPLPTGLEPARLLRLEVQPLKGAFPGMGA